MVQPKANGVMEVNNPGEGDCGYYSLEIAIIPTLLRELEEIKKQGEDLLDKKNMDNFFDILADPDGHGCSGKIRFLTKIYKELESGECHMDDVSPHAGIEEQKALFHKWLIGITNNAQKIIAPKASTEKKDTLLPGVHFLRTLLAKIRKKNLTLAVLPNCSKKNDEERFLAFSENTTGRDRTAIHLDMQFCLQKHLGEIVDENNSETVNHNGLNRFTKDFITWWKKNNNNSLPTERTNKAEYYKLKATFIACLYGNIDLNKETIGKADAWWAAPKIDTGSVAVKVADLVKGSKTWAEAEELRVLARDFGAELVINPVERDIEKELNHNRLIVNNKSKSHWTTVLSSADAQALNHTQPIVTKKIDIVAEIEKLKKTLGELSGAEAKTATASETLIEGLDFLIKQKLPIDEFEMEIKNLVGYALKAANTKEMSDEYKKILTNALKATGMDIDGSINWAWPNKNSSENKLLVDTKKQEQEEEGQFKSPTFSGF